LNLLDAFYTVAVGFTVVTVLVIVAFAIVLGYKWLGYYVDKRFGEDTLTKFFVCLLVFLIVFLFSYEVGKVVIRGLSGHP